MIEKFWIFQLSLSEHLIIYIGNLNYEAHAFLLTKHLSDISWFRIKHFSRNLTQSVLSIGLTKFNKEVRIDYSEIR